MDKSSNASLATIAEQDQRDDRRLIDDDKDSNHVRFGAELESIVDEEEELSASVDSSALKIASVLSGDFPADCDKTDSFCSPGLKDRVHDWHDSTTSPLESDDEQPGYDCVDSFNGWARVFFQGRNDPMARQVLPSNGATLSRDSYLYIKVEANQLCFYPHERDLRLIVDPPIDLKYFYAIKVPGSQAGAALFLEEDDRDFQRYLFRLEFRNDDFFQVPSQVSQLSKTTKTVKQLQKSTALQKAGKDAHAMFLNHEEAAKLLQREGRASLDAYMAYLETMGDVQLASRGAADAFVAVVNHSRPNDMTPKRALFQRSWGNGYDNFKFTDYESHDDESESEYESDYLYQDSDDNEMETVEDSFRTMFRLAKDKI